ncbi:galactitol-1-phosphate 5-dehydrogenase [Enterococcus florum]|uniref:Galactitol-1-phosphate 5-dehydrogenase n=1 Tax=Enterococcus florum TaxID=2480627 RepID=A0A4P5P4U2_9ENTE|nr:galactitol-1-phosphate 5-dehydrogenase [Enterococcus florum]GCF92446.1 galactitol-1-phosphate 5-dehydrogenase [Enterococcus florum]
MSEQMEASVLVEPGVLEVKKVAVPEIGEQEVLIKVAYAGICGSDVPRANLENGARMYPIILGHEFSGTVDQVGSNVTKLKVGDKVAVAPLIPDPNSEYTKEGYYGLSDNYNIIGTGSNGAFSEYVKVPEDHAVVMPEELDLLSAAGVEPATISWHALRRAQIEVGDTVAVLGCGPIGQFAIQIAKIFGAKTVVAVDIFDDKLQLAKELGADVAINSKEVDLEQAIRELTGLGVDVVIETAGSKITQKQSLLITRKHGRIVFVGISHQDLPLSEKEAERIMRAELTVTGSWNSYTAPYPGRAWEATLDEMSKGRIKFKEMISHEISLEELPEILPKMFKRELSYNKIVVAVHPE